LPVLQSVSVAQAPAQVSLLPGHVYRPQLGGAFVGLPGLSLPSWVHVPGVALHVSHVPAHAVAQQKPSTQLPLAHSRQSPWMQSMPAALLQVAPCAFCDWQTPFSSQ
jgi:hypothetical protein